MYTDPNARFTSRWSSRNLTRMSTSRPPSRYFAGTTPSTIARSSIPAVTPDTPRRFMRAGSIAI